MMADLFLGDCEYSRIDIHRAGEGKAHVTVFQDAKGNLIIEYGGAGNRILDEREM